MQQLRERRLTNTPRGISHAPGNCGLLLNREKTLSVTDLKTSLNNPDATLTGFSVPGKMLKLSCVKTEQLPTENNKMVVYVLNHKSKPLMPCSPRKARVLLKQRKAKVVRRTPFVIQLVYGNSGYKQPVTLKLDSGYENIGISAVSAKRELYSAEVELRSDIVKLNSERRAYRRARRYRKTWYRKPRFDNRKKPEGWLAPSIQHKLDSHIKVIKDVSSFLPIKDIVVEVSSFDIQKIQNPDISGIEYQEGPQKEFANVRQYVLHRDNYTCQYCKGKSKNKTLEVHHLISRQIGGDRPENLVTLCLTCHAKATSGKIILELKPQKGFRPETFMTTVKWKIVNSIRALGYQVTVTYGYITKANRKALDLPKSHANDAFALAGIIPPLKSGTTYHIKQARKCNRKLFRGERSHIQNTAPRFVLGFQRYDKVMFSGLECFVFGRRKSGYFDLRKLDGTKVNASAKAKECRLLESARTFLIERRQALLPVLKGGVSAPKK